MIHFMKLNDAPFENITSGDKTIELRLYDEKRQRISVGDIIVFNQVLCVTVTALHRFPDFETLYQSLPLDKCGYKRQEVAAASPDDMLAYYSRRQIKKYGAVGIEFVFSRAQDFIGQPVRITVDRPLGSFHPKHKDLYYPVNYGYIEGVLAPDGEEQDVYILGVDKPVKAFEGEVIAVIHRLNDVEDKWVAAPCGMRMTKEKIEAAVRFQEQYFDYEIIM